MRKICVFLIFMFIISILFVQIPINDSKETGNILIVQIEKGDNYTSIQDAIDNANINDIILVKSGLYNETISINKSITLTGENKNTTIIDNNYSGFYTIIIQTSNVNISGFTIQNSTVGIYVSGNKNISNSTITNNIFRNNRGGIYFGNSSNKNIIFKNLISTNDGDGIRLYRSYDNEIYDNAIEYQNSYGIILWDSSYDNKIFDNQVIGNKNGIGLRRWSDNNFVIHNNITDNENSGITLGYSFYNNITENIIRGNSRGVSISDSSYNNISTNLIKDNMKGIYLFDSTNNIIFEDNIFENNIEDISEGSKKFKTSGFEVIIIFLAVIFMFMINKLEK